MSYSPVEGLIHKYELGLIYVAATCSAHCRFCYREELIAKKEVKRPDGTIAPKGLAKIKDIVNYVWNTIAWSMKMVAGTRKLAANVCAKS